MKVNYIDMLNLYYIIGNKNKRKSFLIRENLLNDWRNIYRTKIQGTLNLFESTDNFIFFMFLN